MTDETIIAEGYVEDGIVKFVLNETYDENSNFTLAVDARGGNQYIIDDFTNYCTEEKTNIESPSIEDHVIYEINGEVPSFSFEQVSSGDVECGILAYEIFASKEDESEHHPDFQTNEIDDGKIKFQLNEEKIGVFEYYLKITA